MTRIFKENGTRMAKLLCKYRDEGKDMGSSQKWNNTGIHLNRCLTSEMSASLHASVDFKPSTFATYQHCTCMQDPSSKIR